MTEPAPVTELAAPAGEMLDKARQLVQALEAGDEGTASLLINDMSHVRETELFKEMGRLTRALHDAITSVQSDTTLAKLAESDMPEARQRLDYVISLTEQAANRTMNAVDDCIPICNEMNVRAEDIADSWLRLTRRELSGDEFRALSRNVQLFLENVQKDTQTLKQNLTEILLAQDFQDLTGQVIRRVTHMVRELEDKLVDLIKRNGQLAEHPETDATGPDIAAEGPQLRHAERDDVVSGQDDVDDLLSSLGF